MREKRTRTCPVCGTSFTRKGEKHAWTKTCSRSCGRRLVNGSAVELFWSHVDRSGGESACWPWTGSKVSGYGCVGWNGKIRKAHRVAWEITHSECPTGDVLHTCDNPVCCNPNHLFLGTHADNMSDMVRKGRSSRKFGEANGRAVLTSEQVRVIRATYAAGGISQQALANQFGVHQTAISKIVRHISWPDGH